MTHAAALFGYRTSGAVLTLALPLGLFILVMIGLSFVFRRRTVPAHRPVARAPLADRGTPPRVGARSTDVPADDDDTDITDTAAHDTVAGDTLAGDTGASDTGASDDAAGDPD